LGKNVSYTGYGVQDGVARDTTKLAVLKLVCDYVREAGGQDPRKEFVFSSEKRNGAVVFWRVRAGGLRETDDDPMFLHVGDAFM